jgi:hypothetical protein
MRTIFHRLALPNHALLFDLEQLYRCLQTVPDRRKRRGRRYPLAARLMIWVLAKLAGQVSLRAISHWAKLRHHELSRLFSLNRQTMPHYSTWSRVLGHGVSPEEVEAVLGQFFGAQKRSQARQQRQPPGLSGWQSTAGHHSGWAEKGAFTRLSAYLPEQGVVLMEMEVGEKTNEITVARHP